ncbi:MULTISPECIES: PAAR domain-containing protein [unclassified Pseudomonas]|uniref:PAAR domain-containing protein n=1 Tax=unclassified Pseudomonas TaxID=196821 RepID=UPI0025FF5041|nr:MULTISPECIES: PAAR domain-containing protein [unclassified Pseudomonas]
MDAQAAARLGDEVAHGFGVAAMLAGAVAGALVGAAIIAVTAATGGLAAVILAGSIAAGGLSMFQLVKGLSAVFNLPEPTTGSLIRGSPNVFINLRNAMRASEDVSSSCSGFPMGHPYWPFPVTIAEGSATVYFNGKPAARLKSKMSCGAHIKSGSHNTFIGGPTLRMEFVLDIEGWMHNGLEVLGVVAAAGALVLAAVAGLAALMTAGAIGGAVYGGMELLGQLGDRLGPGYRDLLQGMAGLALLGAGPKMASLSAERNAARLASQTLLLEVRTASQVNEAWVAEGNLPAWLEGTLVNTEVVPAGTQYQMVVAEGQAEAIVRGKPAFGGFASPDPIPSQAYARDKLVILEEFKSDVSRVITVETTAPQKVYKGITGPLGEYNGGVRQVQFVDGKNVKLVGTPRVLPLE